MLEFIFAIKLSTYNLVVACVLAVGVETTTVPLKVLFPEIV